MIVIHTTILIDLLRDKPWVAGEELGALLERQRQWRGFPKAVASASSDDLRQLMIA